MAFQINFSVLLAIFCAAFQHNLVFGEICINNGVPHVKLGNDVVYSGFTKFSREGRAFNSFTGIQFATAPGRFQEAKLTTAIARKGDVISATTPGPICPQANAEVSAGEEDCLNLNVYVPTINNTFEQSNNSLPVMIWVHGGSFMFGDGGLTYDVRYFMDEDVILVTFNYRIGVLGFFSTGDSVIPGNYGLKDQVLALRWVQENIKSFGGDPNRVTVFGNSAGAVSVHYLMLSPTTKGLFHNAISQSGSALSPWAYHPNPRESAVDLATFLNCPTASNNSSEITSVEILECLKKQSVETLLRAQVAFKHHWPTTITLPFSFGPVKEPASHPTAFLTYSPWEMVRNKSIPLPSIPWIVGVNEDEGATFYAGVVLNNQSMTTELDSNFDSLASIALEIEPYVIENEQLVVTEKIRNFYFGNTSISLETRENLTNLYSDIYFIYSVYKAATETALRGHPVYLYQYTHRGPDSLMRRLGLPLAEDDFSKVGHGDDILLQFRVDDIREPGPGRDLIQPETIHEEFSKNFIKLWTSFAIHGSPKHSWGDGRQDWQPISTEELNGNTALKWCRIDTNTTNSVENIYCDRMQFCDKLWSEHLAPIYPEENDSAAPKLNSGWLAFIFISFVAIKFRTYAM